MNTKYQEALERARERKKLAVQNGDDITVRVLDEIFPELRESEDEKIATRLIHLIHTGGYLEEPSRTRILAWLEKQKAKERLDRMAPIYNDKESFESALEKAWKYYNESASRKVDSFEDDYIECVFSKGFREGFLYKEKQKEQKPADDFDGKAMLYVSRKSYDMGYRDGKLKQKPVEVKDPSMEELEAHNKDLHNFKVFAAKQAKEHHISFVHDFEWNNFCGEILSYFNQSVGWSEEDEKVINDASCWIAEYAGSLIHDNYAKASSLYGLAERLKSLRPQPKQEWSEEEAKKAAEDYANEVPGMTHESDGSTIEDYDKPYNDFLAGVLWAKHRSIFQNGNTHWKPSEEQMIALKDTIEFAPEVFKPKCTLETLYNDLKRLED